MASFEPSDKIGGLTEEELEVFLAQPWNARIATITPEGWPYVAPVWYELDLDAFTWPTTLTPSTRASSSRPPPRSSRGPWPRA